MIKVNVTVDLGDSLGLHQEEYEAVYVEQSHDHTLVVTLQGGSTVTFEPDEWTALAMERVPS